MTQDKAFEDLSLQELQVIDGGKNVLEYVAQGVGYVVGGAVNAFESYTALYESAYANGYRGPM